MSRAEQSGAARAGWAWDAVGQASKRDGSDRYATLARRLPALIQNSGLGQTMAFLFAKSKGDKTKPESLLLRQLHERVLVATTIPMDTPPDKAMDVIVALDRDDYRRATREVQASLVWLKRFVEGRFGDVESP